MVAEELDLVHPVKFKGKATSLEAFYDSFELMKIFLKMIKVLLLYKLCDVCG